MANSCKYYKQRREMSYDGVTWIPLDEYRKGDLVPGTSSDCSSPTPTIYRWVQTDDTICVSMFDGKFKAIYLGGSEYELPCDGNTTLTSGDTQPTGYTASAMTSAEIGCVTSIGRVAFYGCTSLTSVTIPDSVTSIDVGAFYLCSGLTSITIPDSVTSIGDSTFSWCTSLKSIGAKGSGASVEIPSGVTSISYNTFYFCTGLTSVTIPASVTVIDNGAFQYCSGLTSITIPSGVTSIGQYVFKECSSLTSINIPNSVTSIGATAFQFCTNLTSITIGSGVSSIDESAFYGCSGLSSVTINATTPPTLGNYVFDYTSNCPIYVPAASLSQYQSSWSQYSSRIQAIS